MDITKWVGSRKAGPSLRYGTSLVDSDVQAVTSGVSISSGSITGDLSGLSDSSYFLFPMNLPTNWVLAAV